MLNLKANQNMTAIHLAIQIHKSNLLVLIAKITRIEIQINDCFWQYAPTAKDTNLSQPLINIKLKIMNTYCMNN